VGLPSNRALATWSRRISASISAMISFVSMAGLYLPRNARAKGLRVQQAHWRSARDPGSAAILLEDRPPS
jgi:hypothetical protein